MIRTISVLSVFLLTACAGPIPASASRAVADSIFSSRSPGCLEVDGHDPKADLMRAIQATHKRVYPASRCAKAEVMFRTPAGDKTERTELYGWRRLSPWHARLQILNDSNFMFGSSGSTISLKLKNGRWIVSEYSTDSIS